MPVSGIVLTCGVGAANDVAARVAALGGVEIHGVLPDDRIVAVIDAESVHDEVTLMSKLHEVDGVLAVMLAYHNFEDTY